MHDDTTDIDQPSVDSLYLRMPAQLATGQTIRLTCGAPATTLDTLRAIAALLKTLPHSQYLSVSLGTQGREGIELLQPLGAHSRTFHDSEDRPLTYAILEVDGVEFTATHTEKP